MQYIMTVKKTTMTNGMKEAIESRLNSLKKFLNEDTVIYVTVEVMSHTAQNIEVLLTYKGNLIKAEAVDSDLYVALDMVSGKINNSIIKQININKTVRKVIPDFITHKSNADAKGNEQLIAKRKHFDMKPMFELEAIEQMKLLNHQSFMFFNVELQAMCLIYTRKDGRYGVIEGAYSEGFQ